jgi:RNA polymerase sigma-70 factor (ECF subfamily)
VSTDFVNASMEAKPASQRTPEQLAARAAEGSLEAFGELVKRFEVRLFNFLLRRTGSRSDAEDLTQETFIRAWEKIHRYEPKWRFSTWLFTIGARLAVSHHRKRRPSLRWIEEEETESTPLHEREDDRNSGAKLWALAGRVLTPEQHTALWLRYAEDMSIDEIAAVLKKSLVGVRVMLFRTRQVLAEQVDRENEASRVYDAKASMPPPPLLRRGEDGLAGSMS